MKVSTCNKKSEMKNATLHYSEFIPFNLLIVHNQVGTVERSCSALTNYISADSCGFCERIPGDECADRIFLHSRMET